MKAGITFLFFLLQCGLYSQTITVTVVDSSTGSPLVFANLFNLATQQGFATDVQGEAVLDLAKIEGEVEVTYVGYSTKVIDRAELTDGLQISLASQYYQMDEVQVVAERGDITGAKIVDQVIKNIRDNYDHAARTWGARYYETYTNDADTVLKVASTLQVRYDGYPKTSFVKKSYRKFYEGEFNAPAYPLLDKTGRYVPFDNPLFFKYYASVDDSVFVKDLQVSDNSMDDMYRFHTTGGPLSMLAMDKVKYLSDIFHRPLLKQYDFRIESLVETPTGPEYVVSFKPKLTSPIKNIHWNEKVKYAILSGRIFVTQANLVVRKIECQLTSRSGMFSYMFNEPWQLFPHSSTVEVWYDNYQGRYSLAKVRTMQKALAGDSTKWRYEHNLTLVRELVRDDTIPVDNDYFYHYQDMFLANFMDVIQFQPSQKR